MQRRSLLLFVVAMQLALVGVGLLLAGAKPAGAAGDPPIAPESTAQPTIPAGTTVTPTVPRPGATATSTAGLPRPGATAEPTVPACEILFSDVHGSDYFYEPVRGLYCAGAVSGYGDNTFRPYNTTTRGQMAKIIVLATRLKLVVPARPTFADVPADNPFYTYIETAAAKGLAGGYADGTFRWYNNVTRGQLAKIVVGARGWTLLAPATPTFADVPADNPFYSHVETANAHAAISGYDAPGGRLFQWSSNATRGQIAKIVFLSAAGGP